MSFLVANNNDVFSLACFKEFCFLNGYPQILQINKGVKNKKHLFEKYCMNIILFIYLTNFTSLK